jgi:hypothetical protein
MNVRQREFEAKVRERRQRHEAVAKPSTAAQPPGGVRTEQSASKQEDSVGRAGQVDANADEKTGVSEDGSESSVELLRGEGVVPPDGLSLSPLRLGDDAPVTDAEYESPIEAPERLVDDDFDYESDLCV